jgi:outer membrane protein assembly factor BamB
MKRIDMPRTLRAFLALTLSASLSHAADWPVFHGPNGDNKSPDTGLLQQWPEGGPELLWTADFIGSGYSGVSVGGNRIYISGNVRRGDSDLAMLFCLDMDGNNVWEQDNGPAHAETRRYPGTRATPAVDGDFVYDASALGQVTCISAETGEKLWSRNLLTDYGAPQPFWILAHSPVSDGDHLVCMVGGPRTLVVFLDKRTGATVREFANPAGAATSYMTPYFFEFEGIRVLLVMSNVTVEGYNADTGQHLFSIPWVNQRSINVTMPIYRDGGLFISHGYGGGSAMFRLSKNDDGTITATKAWHEERFDNRHGGVIIVGDYVYGSSQDGHWISIHLETGEIGYRERSIGTGSVHYADGLIYGLAERNRTVILLRPEPNAFVEVSRFQLPNDINDWSWAHPVVVGGRLYIRHAQYLYCYDVAAR